MNKQLLASTLAACLAPGAAMAWVALDPADLSGGGSWSGLVVGLGVLAWCATDNAMARRHAPAAVLALAWVFRVAVALLALGLFLVPAREAWPALAVLWGAGQCALGIYLAGVAKGAASRSS